VLGKFIILSLVSVGAASFECPGDRERACSSAGEILRPAPVPVVEAAGGVDRPGHRTDYGQEPGGNDPDDHGPPALRRSGGPRVKGCSPSSWAFSSWISPVSTDCNVGSCAGAASLEGSIA
jgi:hypothetical protein